MQYLDGDFHVTGGMCVEIVREIQRRIGDTSPIQGVPWARGYKAVQVEPNVMLFSMARTAERENLVRWVGPLAVRKSVLVTLKASHIRLTNLEDAKKLKAIGIVTDEVRGQILRTAGFTNLNPTTSEQLNVKQLVAGAAEAFTSTDLNMVPVIKAAGYNPADFEVALAYDETPSCLAFSLGTSGTVIGRWDQALKEMRKDGTLQKILRPYLPK